MFVVPWSIIDLFFWKYRISGWRFCGWRLEDNFIFMVFIKLLSRVIECSATARRLIQRTVGGESLSRCYQTTTRSNTKYQSARRIGRVGIEGAQKSPTLMPLIIFCTSLETKWYQVFWKWDIYLFKFLIIFLSHLLHKHF